MLGGTNDSVICVNWEDPTLYVDKRGHFHVLAHAWRGQDEDWPQPGCRKTQNVSSGSAPFWRLVYPGPCTSNGGHAYSVDGREWHVSPVPPYTAQTDFDDGSTVFWRARESVRRNVTRQTATVSTALLCASNFLGRGLLRRAR